MSFVDDKIKTIINYVKDNYLQSYDEKLKN